MPPVFGTPSYVQAEEDGTQVDLSVGERATFDIVDWNNDGRSDLVVGSRDGEVREYLNRATSGLPDLASPIVVQAGSDDLVDQSGRSSVAVFDLDGDGRKDLVVGDTNGAIVFYRNIGTDVAPASQFQPVLAGGAAIALYRGGHSIQAIHRRLQCRRHRESSRRHCRRLRPALCWAAEFRHRPTDIDRAGRSVYSHLPRDQSPRRQP